MKNLYMVTTRSGNLYYVLACNAVEAYNKVLNGIHDITLLGGECPLKKVSLLAGEEKITTAFDKKPQLLI